MQKYITIMQNPRHRQMTIDELLFGDLFEYTKPFIEKSTTNTRTMVFEGLPVRLNNGEWFDRLTAILEQFNEKYGYLAEGNRHDLYYEFKIPKKSGGFRKIDAPNKELSDALRELKKIFEDDFGVLYHTSAFAYVKGRSTLDCVKRHQANESKWFLKLDLSNFFGSTTKEFVMKQFGKIYPFSEVTMTARGKEALSKAIDLAFLDGGLPQGTPLSPIITNIMMIPIDHCIANKLRSFENQNFTYTRYADDFQISSRYNFNFRKIEELVVEVLNEFNAPFMLNTKKTRYGSSAGQNWNLGLMLNKDNKITVGHKKKRHLKAAITSYIMDKVNGNCWGLSDVQELAGQISYCHMVEPETIDEIVIKLGNKFHFDVMAEIKTDLKKG